jgi:hypothetical protein
MRADRLTELEQTRLDYWTALVGRMGDAITFGAPGPGHQLRAGADTFGSGKFVLIALANVRPELRIGVGVEISGPEDYYAALEKDASDIEREIGCKLEWNRETEVRDIWLYRRADFFDRSLWREQHEWLREKLEAFRRVLNPRIAELLGGVSESKRAI